jgi:dTDP-4-dehydrorhamnose reductase
MVLLLGASNYAGQAFARALRRRKDAFIPLSRSAFDYARFEFLLDYVRKVKPELLINAAGTPEIPGQEVPESERMDVLETNTLLPQTIARVCEITNTPWGHVSSGSIYSGARIIDNGHSRIEEDLGLPATRRLFATHPDLFRGFSESDEPNFSFKAAPCTFYSGTKALAEEALSTDKAYLWRLRLPFSEQDDPSNFLSQLLSALTASPATGLSLGNSPHLGPLPQEMETPRGHDDSDTPTSLDPRSTTSLSPRKRAGGRGSPGVRDFKDPLARVGAREPSSSDILHDAINSLSQVDECVSACLELWDRRAPYGIYNVVNPGAICTQDIIQRIQRILRPARQLQLLVYESDTQVAVERPLRSDCILDSSKLLNTGIKLRPIEEAIDKALRHWQSSSSSALKTRP